jgi:hypothetical protein
VTVETEEKTVFRGRAVASPSDFSRGKVFPSSEQKTGKEGEALENGPQAYREFCLPKGRLG